jgi:non-specific serine/threonine protein kinase
MTEALALWRSLDLPSDEAMALRVLGWVAYETGDAATCIQSVEASLALFRAVGHPSGVAGALGLLAQQVHAQGDDERALGAYHEALQLWSRIDTRWGATRGPGGSTTASTFPRWAGIDDRRLLVLALTGVAAIAAAHHQGDQAAALIGAADARRDAVGMPMSPSVFVNHERTRERVRAALGDDRFAIHHAAGQTLLLADAVALALAITAPEPTRETSVPPPSTAPGLTARQVEVLRLIVAGRSDREIAAALFIGHRTAQDHVSHILARLGVVNRTEAAAIAVRDGLL